MGLALLRIQKAEQVLKLCTTYFIPEAGRTWEMMQTEEARERKKTLGHFLKKLREKVHVDPTFDDVLDRFLADRNTFVHHIEDMPNFSLGTEAGLLVGIDFVRQLTDRAEHVTNVIAGFVNLFGDALGFNGSTKDIDPANPDDFYKMIALMAFKLPKST